jgi:hypothetical protein
LLEGKTMSLFLDITTVLVGLLYLPFSFYLTYLMLMKIGASDLMWFLFWLLIPIGIVFQIISKLAEMESKK